MALSTTADHATAADARALLMHGQGLLADPSRRATPAQVHNMIEHMGFVQVDTINVAVRAHEHILLSRFHDFTLPSLTGLLERDRTMFEHWTHDASIIPTRWFAHWKHRFNRYRASDRLGKWMTSRLGNKPKRVLDEVLERIETEGPLRSRDFEHRRAKNDGDGWWNWKPAKAALEYLWRVGDVSVAGRENFHKIYDLTHRVHPRVHDEPVPDDDAHIDWACRVALERLGFATPKEIAGFFATISVQQAKQWCTKSQCANEIVAVSVESADGSNPVACFALADWRARLSRLRASSAETRLLSPFDPVMRDRARVLRLFNFDYRFEAFVPAARRQYGYYVLPILEGDRIVGRTDLKLHRDKSTLVVKGLWWEPGVRPTKKRLRSFEAAAWVLAKYGEADTIEIVPE